MPLNFSSVPLAKLQAQQAKAKVRVVKTKLPLATKALVNKVKKVQNVNLLAYGGKLFEPVMKKQKSIKVHFANQLFEVDNNLESFCRFSEDGFFVIKYLPRESTCLLYYFLTPIKVVPNLTIAKACEESPNFKYFICVSDFVEGKLLLSALDKVIEVVRGILQEKVVEEAFRKRQKLINSEEQDWKLYFEDLHKLEDEDERKEENVQLELTEQPRLDEPIQHIEEPTLQNQNEIKVEELEEEIPKIPLHEEEGTDRGNQPVKVKAWWEGKLGRKG